MKGISIIICTYNGRSRLAATLASVRALRLPQGAGLELLVVDNASTDGSAEYCTEWAKDRQFDLLRILHESQPGLSHARQCGFQAARYPYILLCDDDNHLAEDYLQIGYRLLEAHSAMGALGGHGKPLFETTKPDWFERFHYSFAVGSQHHRAGKIDRQVADVYGAGCFLRKEALEKVYKAGFTSALSDRKGASLSSGGDVELCYALQIAGYEIWYESKLTFDHYMPASRMDWPYYLKLKKAIPAQHALMLAYRCMLENTTRSAFQFRIYYFKMWYKAKLNYLGYLLKKLLGLSKSSQKEREVGAIVLPQKFYSFFVHYSRAGDLFRQLVALERKVDGGEEVDGGWTRS